jgi:hypothetical protein
LNQFFLKKRTIDNLIWLLVYDGLSIITLYPYVVTESASNPKAVGWVGTAVGSVTCGAW